ncbi:MAG: hypothetical protein Q3996_00970 [Candidatus Saccharibacteria bacterium]|nr:hypothetical protein [Candidatus Saccharibacteria bacterium]
MQDIDFEALDQAVNQIMDQAKHDSKQTERVKQIKKQQLSGRSMDVISPTKKAPMTMEQLRSARQSATNKINQPQIDRSIQDIVRRKTKVKLISKPVTSLSSSTQTVVSSSKPIERKTALSTSSKPILNQLPVTSSKSRRADLIRRRRRGSEKQRSIILSHQQPEELNTNQPAVLHGKVQTETLSTKQPDGTETVYNRSEFDYAVKFGLDSEAIDSPRVAMPRVASPVHSINTITEQSAVPKTSQAPAEPVKSHSVNLDMQPAPRVAVARAKTRSDNVESVRTGSPFIETAKVEKRPLGVPAAAYRSTENVIDAPKIDFGDDESTREPNLYNGNSRLADKSVDKKSHWLAWVVAIIAVLLIVGVAFYFVYVYNK